MPLEDQGNQRGRINWVAVTGIATILAVAIPGMNYIFRSSEYLIVASGDYSNYSNPVDLTEQLAKFEKLLGYDEIEKQLKPSKSDMKPDSKADEKEKSKSAELAEVDARVASIALAIKLGSYLREGYPAELIRDINS